MSALSTKLIEYRKQCGLTQEEAARRIHISRSTLAGYESGTRQPNFATLKAIANSYGIEVSSLYDETTRYQSDLDDDDELTPGKQILLQTLKGATEEEIMQAVKIIEALRK